MRTVALSSEAVTSCSLEPPAALISGEWFCWADQSGGEWYRHGKSNRTDLWIVTVVLYCPKYICSEATPASFGLCHAGRIFRTEGSSEE